MAVTRDDAGDLLDNLWTHDVPLDEGFRQAAESFGGALDLRRPECDPRIQSDADRNARELSRALFVRPLNIFHAVLGRVAARSPRCAARLSQVRFGYIYSPAPNAYCWQDTGRTFMGVTSGLAHFVHGSAESLLSTPDFLRTFLDGAEEEIPGDPTELRRPFDIHQLLAFRGPRVHRLRQAATEETPRTGIEPRDFGYPHHADQSANEHRCAMQA